MTLFVCAILEKWTRLAGSRSQKSAVSRGIEKDERLVIHLKTSQCV